MWKAIKSLSTGDKGQSSKEVLNAGGRCYTTDRQKAGLFVNQYANVSKLKIGKEDRSKRRIVMNRLAKYRKEEEDFGREITWEELAGALSQMDERKKGGVDEVEVAMLKRLGMKMMELWRKIFNKSMTEGLVLGKWKKAEMIPLLKDGKDPKDPGSYRSVSLT